MNALPLNAAIAAALRTLLDLFEHQPVTMQQPEAAAAFQMAAAAEFLIQGGMPRAAGHVLSAMQFVESEYQRDVADAQRHGKDGKP